MRMKVGIISFLLISGIVLYLPDISQNAESTSDTSRSTTFTRSENKEIIYWNYSYKGPIYSWDTTPEPYKYRQVGYSDGSGNIEISSFDILSNQSLIIEPGIKVKFIDVYHRQFQVFGDIISLGTLTDPIKFIGNISKENYWSGLTIFDGESTVRLENCTFENGENHLIYREVDIINCEFIGDNHIDIKNNDRRIERVTVFNTRFTELFLDSNAFQMGFYVYDTDEVIFNNNIIEHNENITFNFGDNEFLMFHNNEVLSKVRTIALSSKKQISLHNNVFEIEYGKMYITNPMDSPIYIEDEVINSYKLVLSNKIEVHDCEINGFVTIDEGVIFTDNEVNGGVFIHGNNDFENNKVTGGLMLDFINQEKPIRNNYFENVVVDYWAEMSQTEGYIDIRYNSWGVDYGLEEILDIDRLEREYPGLILDYLPFYDRNGSVSDTDQLPNDWEMKYGLSMHENNDDEDPDNDGLTNLVEYHFSDNFPYESLDPTKSDTDGDDLPDPWEIEYGLDPLTYNRDNDSEIESVDNRNWDGLPGDGYLGEGFSNYQEYLAGTDPNLFDTDRDGMEDGWEVHFGLDPLKDDSQGDLDNDGMKNAREFRDGYDPTDPDDPPRTFFEKHPWLRTPLIIGILLIPVIVIVLIVLWKKKRESVVEAEIIGNDQDRQY